MSNIYIKLFEVKIIKICSPCFKMSQFMWIHFFNLFKEFSILLKSFVTVWWSNDLIFSCKIWSSLQVISFGFKALAFLNFILHRRQRTSLKKFRYDYSNKAYTIIYGCSIVFCWNQIRFVHISNTIPCTRPNIDLLSFKQVTFTS